MKQPNSEEILIEVQKRLKPMLNELVEEYDSEIPGDDMVYRSYSVKSVEKICLKVLAETMDLSLAAQLAYQEELMEKIERMQKIVNDLQKINNG